MLHDGFTFLQERIGSCTVTLSIDLSYLMSSLGLDLLITWRLLKARPKYLTESVSSMVLSESAQGCCSARVFESIAEAVICLMRLNKACDVS